MLSRRYVFGLAAATFALLTASAWAEDWPLGRFDCAGSGFTRESITTPLVHSWQYNTYRAGRNPAAPVVAGRILYFSGGDQLVALDAESGALKWKFPADQPLTGTIKASPAVYGDIVYVASTDNNLYALNAADGILKWTYPTGGAIRSSLAVSERTIFFGSDDNSLHAVDADTGETAWRGPFATKDDVAIPPAVGSGYVVFVASDGTMYGANAGSGAMRWDYRLPLIPSRSAPVISSEVVYIAAGSNLYAIGLKTGRLRWVTPFSTEIAAGPTVAEQIDSDGESPAGPVIYVITRNKKLYALSSNGKARWPEPVDLPYTSSVAPTVAFKTVIVASDRGAVFAYSTAGELMWSYAVLPANFTSTGGYTAVSSSPVVAGKRLYVVTEDGALHCFDSDMPDNSPPEAFALTPTRSLEMSGSPPISVSAVIFDLGSGVNKSSIELSVDGGAVESSYDPTTSTVSYTTTEKSTPRILPDGRHQLALKARDWSGNLLTETWSFVVDNRLRPPTPPKPAAVEKPAADKQKTGRWRRTPPQTTPTPTTPTAPGPSPYSGGPTPTPPPPPPQPGGPYYESPAPPPP